MFSTRLPWPAKAAPATPSGRTRNMARRYTLSLPCHRPRGACRNRHDGCGGQCRHPQGDQGPRLYPHRGRQRDPLRLRRSERRRQGRRPRRRHGSGQGARHRSRQHPVGGDQLLLAHPRPAGQPLRHDRGRDGDPPRALPEGGLFRAEHLLWRGPSGRQAGDPKSIHTYADFARRAA